MQEEHLQQQRELQGEADAGYRDEEDRRGDFGELEDEDDEEGLGLDIDNMGYEALQALGDAIGNVSKGLGSTKIAALPVMSYACHKAACQQGTVAMDRCCICQESYEDTDRVTPLPCNHCYHPPCIQQWLALNKVCPVCNKELGAKTPQPSTRR
ncbi:MAG: hypothetical protein WDW36_006715 [Sanguina aurantia]